MIFPWHVIIMENGCIAQEKKLSNSERRTNEPRIIGRPQFLFKGERWLSARLSYHLNISQIDRRPDLRGDQLVLHSCDTAWCINPDHLYLGTSSQNMMDKSDRHPTWRAGQKTCHTPDGLRRLAEAAHARTGEKRPNSWWCSEEGRKLASQQSKIAWDKSREKRVKKAREFWGSPEGRAKASARNKSSWDRMTPQQRAERSAKMHAGRWGK